MNNGGSLLCSQKPTTQNISVKRRFPDRRIRHTGAKGAVIVTPLRLQRGAKKIAKHKGFHIVYLPAESSFEQFVATCLNRVLAKPHADRVNLSVGLLGGSYTRDSEKT